MTGIGWQVIVELPGKPPVELKPGEVLIGRSRSCALQIAEATVSRQHARLRIGPDSQVIVDDLGSSNGTFVNGERVVGSRALAHGDRLVVGEAELRISILPPVGAAEATMRVELPPLSELALQPAPPLPTVPASTEPRAPEPPRAQPAALPPPPAPAMPAPPASSEPVPRAPSSPMVTRTPASPPRVVPPAPVSPAPKPTPPAPAPAARLATEQPAARGGDLLPSIAEIDKMPLPPPSAARSKTGPIPSPRAGREELAGFWVRVAANLIDGALVVGLYLVTGLLLFLLGMAVPGPLTVILSVGLLWLLMMGAYFLMYLYLPATRGQTPGKKVLQLWIVGESQRAGSPLGWSTALLRWLGHLVCGFTMGIGYLMVAFTERKQGLHDLIAKTRVVRLR